MATDINQSDNSREGPIMGFRPIRRKIKTNFNMFSIKETQNGNSKNVWNTCYAFGLI